MQITTNNLKMILFAIAILCLVTVAAIAGGGCGSGDDDNCQATTGCTGTDAGMMTADADPTAPDADTTPDANSDPCAAYAEYAGQTWTCGGDFTTTDCTMMVFEQDGACYIYCIEACPAPPANAISSGDFTCTTIVPPQVQQHCWH